MVTRSGRSGLQTSTFNALMWRIILEFDDVEVTIVSASGGFVRRPACALHGGQPGPPIAPRENRVNRGI
jgi:hypothetical protein